MYTYPSRPLPGASSPNLRAWPSYGYAAHPRAAAQPQRIARPQTMNQRLIVVFNAGNGFANTNNALARWGRRRVCWLFAKASWLKWQYYPRYENRQGKLASPYSG